MNFDDLYKELASFAKAEGVRVNLENDESLRAKIINAIADNTEARNKPILVGLGGPDPKMKEFKRVVSAFKETFPLETLDAIEVAARDMVRNNASAFDLLFRAFVEDHQDWNWGDKIAFSVRYLTP